MRSRTSTWFETRVRYDKTMEDGQMKKVIEQYVVDAFSFSEAEKFITEEMSHYVSGEFDVKAIAPATYGEIFFSDIDTDDKWFKAKLSFITIDEKTEKAKYFINKIEPLIWKTHKLTGKVDYSSVLLNSKVISETENEILKNILETGEINEELDDNYSKNYNQIFNLIEEKSVENALMIYQFIYALLN